MAQKTITLKFTDYEVKGVSDLTVWGGENACIEMKPFHVKSITKDNLLKNINDNGFGVESINGAICMIYKNFEGTLRYFKTVYVGSISENTEEYFMSPE